VNVCFAKHARLNSRCTADEQAVGPHAAPRPGTRQGALQSRPAAGVMLLLTAITPQDRREKERQELRDLVGKNLLVREWLTSLFNPPDNIA
jgi:hypothetical protein